MTMIPGLVRRAAAEAERQLRGGTGLLVRLGRDLERTVEQGRLLPVYGERIRTLEETVRARDAELGALRGEIGSLVAQLNDRLLPRIDERMDDTERDLATVATSLIRTGRDAAAGRTRLDAAERRLGDLRSRVAQMEQRAGLWRDLQASMARLGDDIDELRGRVTPRHASAPGRPHVPAAPVITHDPAPLRDASRDTARDAARGTSPDPVRDTVQSIASEHITERPA